MIFKIKDKLIGGDKTFVIAEIGLNHNGSYKKCIQMINEALKAGVDACKLQISDPNQSYNKKTLSYKVFKKFSLTKNEIIRLNKYCKKKKIILFSTVGDFNSLEFIKKIKFPAIKISSGLLNNFPLLEKIANTKVPIILSTGMSNLQEIKQSLKIINFKSKNKKIGVLKCTSLYPTLHHNVNLNAMVSLKRKLRLPVGYSDHTIGNLACLAAVAMGAKIIEKHFTLNKKQKGLDHFISADPKELKDLVTGIREIEKIKGKQKIEPVKAELIQRRKMYRFVFSCKKIKKGERFSLKNIALKRTNIKSDKKLPSIYFKKIIGSLAKADIKDDHPIFKADIK